MRQKPHKLDGLQPAMQRQIALDMLLKRRSARVIGEGLGVSDNAVIRWMKKMPEDQKLMLLAEEAERSRVAEAEAAAASVTLFGEEVEDDMKWLLRKLKSLLEEAEGDEDRLLQLGSLKEIRQALMSLADVRGQLSKKVEVSVDVATSPAFLQLKKVVIDVLDNHPEAKTDFLTKMHEMKLPEGPRDVTPSSQ